VSITHSFSQRAARFIMETPVRYRIVGDIDWRQGQTENISRSGVLFRVERALVPSASIEMRLALPVTLAGEAAASIVCLGRVVREGKAFTMAARILEYHFERG
jgi:hypothetical protein